MTTTATDSKISDTASIASSTAEASAALTPEQWKARLTRFYAHHNPACLTTVDTILGKYKGQESHLMRVLVKRWGPEPAAEAAEEDSSTVVSTSAAGSPTASSSAASPAKPNSGPPPTPTPKPSSSSSSAAAAAAAAARGRSTSSASSTAPPTPTTSGVGSGEIPPPNDPRWRAVFETYLKRYEPQRVGELQTIVDKFKGREKEGLISLKHERVAREAAAGETKTGASSPTATSATTAAAAAAAASSGLPPISNTAPTPSVAGGGGGGVSPGARSRAGSAASQQQSSSYPQTDDMYRRRIVRFYRVYAPDKLADVDEKILKNPQYTNREYLLKVLTTKYGPEPVSEPLPGEEWVAPVRGLSYPAGSTLVPWPVRFFYMYLRYRPLDEMAELTRKVEANTGHEGQWMSVLNREWGPEPETPQSYFEPTEDSSNSGGGGGSGTNDQDALARERAVFVQKLSSLFSQFSPQMLPVVRVMAKEPGCVARREQIVGAAREYFLSARPNSEEQAKAQQRLQQEELARQRNARTNSSLLNTSLYSNREQYENEATASANAIRMANSPPNAAAVAANSPSSRYFAERSHSDAPEKPKDLIQQAVDLVHANRLLLHLQEPSDQELLGHLSQPRSPPRRSNNNNSSALVREASSLLSQPPVENPNKGRAHGGSRTNTPTGGGGGGGGGYANGRSASANKHRSASSNAQYSIELSNLTSRNQQLEELVSQLTSALDQKTSELQEVVSTGGGRAGSSPHGGGPISPATTQTVDRVRINHAAQTVTLVDGDHTLAEEELASVRASLGVREHQNRMLRIQLQQYVQELEQKERQLRNSLSCVDSLTETVNMRLRENASLKLDRVPTSDAARFLEVVDEIKQTFQQHYRETKERDEAEMNDYYQLANQMISNRDESIRELTKAVEAMLEDRRRTLAAAAGGAASSVAENEGEVVASSPDGVGGSRSKTADEATIRAPSVLEKKISRLEKALGRANAQLQTQNEEHATLVNALALYSSNNGNNAPLMNVGGGGGGGGSISRASSVNTSTFAANRSAADTDPFAALQAARQRNASELPGGSGVTKDEFHSKIEQLEAARLEAESGRAALTAELHRRSVALEDTEKQRVDAESTVDQLKTELQASQQELNYWRGEAEARKRDVNKLVEHVATLSDALRTQREAIASGNYLLAHSSSPASSAAAARQRSQQGHVANLSMDESEPERKIVSALSREEGAAANHSHASAFSPVSQQQQQQTAASAAGGAGGGGSGATNTPPPDPAESLQIPLGYNRSNMWSMMYGADQERVQQSVQPYPSKGYHIESGGPMPLQGAGSPGRSKKLAGTPADGSTSTNVSVGRRGGGGGGGGAGGGSRSVSFASDPMNAPLPNFNFAANNKVYDPNVTAAASVALARANVAQTMAAGTPSQFL